MSPDVSHHSGWSHNAHTLRLRGCLIWVLVIFFRFPTSTETCYTLELHKKPRNSPHTCARKTMTLWRASHLPVIGRARRSLAAAAAPTQHNLCESCRTGATAIAINHQTYARVRIFRAYLNNGISLSRQGSRTNSLDAGINAAPRA